MVINLIYKKIYLNIIILYTLAYIFKRRINLKCIFLCFSNILYPLSFFIIFKSISIKLIIHFILIIILLKGINFNIFLSSIILYLYALNFRNYANVKIVFNNKIIKLKGLIDTGNMLTYKNYNIIILNKKYLKENLEILYVIPFNTINSFGIMPLIKPLYVKIDGIKYNNILVGISDENNFDLILNPKIWED